MSSSDLVRWGGVAAVVAGVLYLVLVLFNPQGALDISFFSGTFGTVIFFVALLGQLTGIAGIHALQRERYGRLGAAGFLVAFVGFAIEFIFAIVASLSGGALSSVGSLVFVLLLVLGVMATFVGLVLLGVATLRARLLPSWFGVVLIIGLPVAVLLAVAVGTLGWWIAYGAFWLLVGYMLLSSRSDQVQQPTHAR